MEIVEIARLNDDELFAKCRLYGAEARNWRNKFLGLLPEVYRRRLYRERGFQSIFEFSYKLAGVNEDQVKRVLRLDEKFRTAAPQLHQLLMNGEVSPHKLARVASIADKETDVELAAYVVTFSKTALETLVRDVKFARQEEVGADAMGGAGYNSSKVCQDAVSFKSLPGQTQIDMDDEKVNGGVASVTSVAGAATVAGATSTTSATERTLELSPELVHRLQKLKRDGHDINKIMIELLDRRAAEIDHNMQMAAAEQNQTCQSQAQPPRASRHIPNRIKDLIRERYGTKCAVSTCNRGFEEYHHTARFSLIKNHNPLFIAPLCKPHHQIAHAIDEKVQRHRERHREQRLASHNGLTSTPS